MTRTGEERRISDGALFSEEEMRATAAEASDELRDLMSRRGLEYLSDEPPLGEEPSSDEFGRLVEEYDYVADSAPEAFSAHLHYGKLFIVCGSFERAVSALERAVSLKPESADAHCLLGRALLCLGRAEMAHAHYTTACRLDPTLFESAVEVEIAAARINSREGADESAANN